MLSILRSLVQEVNSARDLNEALDIIVSRVQKAMNTEVCSVYLLDPASNRYILMATEGLYKDSVSKVSLAYSEGLVGLVGSREEPINLEDAPSHPRYRYFPETGEERFRSFLGVPRDPFRGVAAKRRIFLRYFGNFRGVVTIPGGAPSMMSHSGGCPSGGCPRGRRYYGLRGVSTEKLHILVPKPWILMKLSCFGHFRGPHLEATPKMSLHRFSRKKSENFFDQKS